MPIRAGLLLMVAIMTAKMVEGIATAAVQALLYSGQWVAMSTIQIVQRLVRQALHLFGWASRDMDGI